MWKRLAFFVAAPSLVLCFINAELKEKEEHEHYVRPDYVNHEHLRTMVKVRRKRCLLVESRFSTYTVIGTLAGLFLLLVNH